MKLTERELEQIFIAMMKITDKDGKLIIFRPLDPMFSEFRETGKVVLEVVNADEI